MTCPLPRVAYLLRVDGFILRRFSVAWFGEASTSVPNFPSLSLAYSLHIYALFFLSLVYSLHICTPLPRYPVLTPNRESCISLPCFKRNQYKYMYENNLSSNLDGFVFESRLPKDLSVVCMYIHERNLIPALLHICRNSVKLH